MELDEEKKKLFEELINKVQSKRVQPEDAYEIAAILESEGWNDDRAAEIFGSRDVFELARDIWDIIRKKIEFAPFTPEEKIGFVRYSIEVIKSFLRGIIFALPMAISVISMLTLRVSLWSYEYLSLELATSIAIGTILSFMAIGGFTQAIARRGFLYISQGYYNMARRITFKFVKIGYISCFLVSAAFVLFNSFFGIFPFRMAIIISLFFFLLSAIWLSVTIMYILRKELAFSGLLALGILCVAVLFYIVKLDIILSQVIVLIFVSIAGIMLVFYFFKDAERKMEKGIAPALPRTSIMLYSIMPYFAYGFLYFTFLYVDRVLAWSTNNSAYMPYIIWFRGEYELGLDFALLMLIFPMGFIEVVVDELMIGVEVSQKNYLANQAHNLNHKYFSMYNKRVLMVMIFSFISALSIYIMVSYIDQNSIALLGRKLTLNPTTEFVFIWALISYSILAIGLMNSIILFSLSQPMMVVHQVVKALIVNIVIGFLLSRWIAYYYAVSGLFAGSITFAVLTYMEVLKVLKNLDYYLYASS